MRTNITIFDGYKGDNSFVGFNNAEFLSVGTWGENPVGGDWKLKFVDKRYPDNFSNSFSVLNYKLTIYGTAKYPYFKT